MPSPISGLESRCEVSLILIACFIYRINRHSTIRMRNPLRRCILLKRDKILISSQLNLLASPVLSKQHLLEIFRAVKDWFRVASLCSKCFFTSCITDYLIILCSTEDFHPALFISLGVQSLSIEILSHQVQISLVWIKCFSF